MSDLLDSHSQHSTCHSITSHASHTSGRHFMSSEFDDDNDGDSDNSDDSSSCFEDDEEDDDYDDDGFYYGEEDEEYEEELVLSEADEDQSYITLACLSTIAEETSLQLRMESSLASIGSFGSMGSMGSFQLGLGGPPDVVVGGPNSSGSGASFESHERPSPDLDMLPPRKNKVPRLDGSSSSWDIGGGDEDDDHAVPNVLIISPKHKGRKGLSLHTILREAEGGGGLQEAPATSAAIRPVPHHHDDEYTYETCSDQLQMSSEMFEEITEVGTTATNQTEPSTTLKQTLLSPPSNEAAKPTIILEGEGKAEKEHSSAGELQRMDYAASTSVSDHSMDEGMDEVPVVEADDSSSSSSREMSDVNNAETPITSHRKQMESTHMELSSDNISKPSSAEDDGFCDDDAVVPSLVDEEDLDDPTGMTMARASSNRQPSMGTIIETDSDVNFSVDDARRRASYNLSRSSLSRIFGDTTSSRRRHEMIGESYRLDDARRRASYSKSRKSLDRAFGTTNEENTTSSHSIRQIIVPRRSIHSYPGVHRKLNYDLVRRQFKSNFERSKVLSHSKETVQREVYHGGMMHHRQLNYHMARRQLQGQLDRLPQSVTTASKNAYLDGQLRRQSFQMHRKQFEEQFERSTLFANNNDNQNQSSHGVVDPAATRAILDGGLRRQLNYKLTQMQVQDKLRRSSLQSPLKNGGATTILPLDSPHVRGPLRRASFDVSRRLMEQKVKAMPQWSLLMDPVLANVVQGYMEENHSSTANVLEEEDAAAVSKTTTAVTMDSVASNKANKSSTEAMNVGSLPEPTQQDGGKVEKIMDEEEQEIWTTLEQMVTSVVSNDVQTTKTATEVEPSTVTDSTTTAPMDVVKVELKDTLDVQAVPSSPRKKSTGTKKKKKKSSSSSKSSTKSPTKSKRKLSPKINSSTVIDACEEVREQDGEPVVREQEKLGKREEQGKSSTKSSESELVVEKATEKKGDYAVSPSKPRRKLSPKLDKTGTMDVVEGEPGKEVAQAAIGMSEQESLPKSEQRLGLTAKGNEDGFADVDKEANETEVVGFVVVATTAKKEQKKASSKKRTVSSSSSTDNANGVAADSMPTTSPKRKSTRKSSVKPAEDETAPVSPKKASSKTKRRKGSKSPKPGKRRVSAEEKAGEVDPKAAGETDPVVKPHSRRKKSSSSSNDENAEPVVDGAKRTKKSSKTSSKVKSKGGPPLTRKNKKSDDRTDLQKALSNRNLLADEIDAEKKAQLFNRATVRRKKRRDSGSGSDVSGASQGREVQDKDRRPRPALVKTKSDPRRELQKSLSNRSLAVEEADNHVQRVVKEPLEKQLSKAPPKLNTMGGSSRGLYSMPYGLQPVKKQQTNKGGLRGLLKRTFSNPKLRDDSDDDLSSVSSAGGGGIGLRGMLQRTFSSSKMADTEEDIDSRPPSTPATSSNNKSGGGGRGSFREIVKRTFSGPNLEEESGDVDSRPPSTAGPSPSKKSAGGGRGSFRDIVKRTFSGPNLEEEKDAAAGQSGGEHFLLAVTPMKAKPESNDALPTKPRHRSMSPGFRQIFKKSLSNRALDHGDGEESIPNSMLAVEDDLRDRSSVDEQPISPRRGRSPGLGQKIKKALPSGENDNQKKKSSQQASATSLDPDDGTPDEPSSPKRRGRSPGVRRAIEEIMDEEDVWADPMLLLTPIKSPERISSKRSPSPISQKVRGGLSRLKKSLSSNNLVKEAEGQDDTGTTDEVEAKYDGSFDVGSESTSTDNEPASGSPSEQKKSRRGKMAGLRGLIKRGLTGRPNVVARAS